MRELGVFHRSRIFETVDSPNSLWVCIFQYTVHAVYIPLITSCQPLPPSADFPRRRWYQDELPSTIIPSIGTFLSRLDNNHAANPYFIRSTCSTFHSSLHSHNRDGYPSVADIAAAALPNRIPLNTTPNLVKQHNGNGFPDHFSILIN